MADSTELILAKLTSLLEAQAKSNERWFEAISATNSKMVSLQHSFDSFLRNNCNGNTTDSSINSVRTSRGQSSPNSLSSSSRTQRYIDQIASVDDHWRKTVNDEYTSNFNDKSFFVDKCKEFFPEQDKIRYVLQIFCLIIVYYLLRFMML
jgi:hypothetical protein